MSALSTVAFRRRYIIKQHLKLQYSTKGKKGPKSIGAAGYFFLVAPATTFCLGVWQYNRRNWKINLIAELQDKVRTVDPVPLNLESVAGVEYKQVSVAGHFHILTTVKRSPLDLGLTLMLRGRLLVVE